MKEFKKFPVKLEYKDNKVTNEVTVYGYICNKQLLVVNEVDFMSDVYLLPVELFNERFQSYKVVNGKENKDT